MKTITEIKTIITQIKPLIKDKYNITEIGIFGSYLKSENKENPIYLLIDYSEAPSLLDIVDLEYHLSDLLEVKVVIFSKNGLKGSRKEQILSEVVYL